MEPQPTRRPKLSFRGALVSDFASAMLASSQRDVGIPQVSLLMRVNCGYDRDATSVKQGILTPAQIVGRVKEDSQCLGGLRMTGFDLGHAFTFCEKIPEVDR